MVPGALMENPPVLTKTQIEQLWQYAGGSAAYSDIASAVALATSGGRPDYVAQQADGTVNRGLWGINSSKGQLSTPDPVTNARGAIQLSNNGTDWRDWPAAYDSAGYLGPTAPARALAGGTSSLGQYPTAGNRPATTVRAANLGGEDDIIFKILEWLGLDDIWTMIRAYFLFLFFILAGSSMIIFGLVLMFMGLRQVKNLGTFVLETGASGIGFGAGAALVSRGERAAAPVSNPAPTTGTPASSAPVTAIAPRTPRAPAPASFRSVGRAPARGVGRAKVPERPTFTSAPAPRRVFFETGRSGTVESPPAQRGIVWENYTGKHRAGGD